MISTLLEELSQRATVLNHGTKRSSNSNGQRVVVITNLVISFLNAACTRGGLGVVGAV